MNTEIRTKTMSVKMTESEWNQIREKAFGLDLKPSTFLRLNALDCQLPRPLADRQLLAHISRIGGNLNQVAHRMNKGDQTTKRKIQIIASAIQMTREIRDAILGNYVEEEAAEEANEQ